MFFFFLIFNGRVFLSDEYDSTKIFSVIEHVLTAISNFSVVGRRKNLKKNPSQQPGVFYLPRP